MFKSVFLGFPLHSTICSSLLLSCSLLTMDLSLIWIQSTLHFCLTCVQDLVEARLTFNFLCNFITAWTLNSAPMYFSMLGLRCSLPCYHVCFLESFWFQKKNHLSFQKSHWDLNRHYIDFFHCKELLYKIFHYSNVLTYFSIFLLFIILFLCSTYMYVYICMCAHTCGW